MGTRPVRGLSLCTGIAGIELGLHLALPDYRTVCAVEWDTYAQSILIARQQDGTFEPFPIWDDVTTFDGREWHGQVDILSAGYPCQPFSLAGKRAGVDDPRHSGLTSRESSESVSPPWFSWKTSQGTFLSDSLMSDWSYANWVIALRLDYSRRLRSARATTESDCSSWLTPRASDRDSHKSVNYVETLVDQIRKWPTPAAVDSNRTESSARNRIASGHQADLPTVVALWPTPNASDYGSHTGKNGERVPFLGMMVKQWPTPTTNDSKNITMPISQLERDGLSSTISHYFPPAHPTPTPGEPSSSVTPTSRRRLNPLFVSWLMGFPDGWTSLKPLETPSCLWWQRMRFEFLRKGGDVRSQLTLEAV